MECGCWFEGNLFLVNDVLVMNILDFIPEEMREQELVREKQLIRNESLEPY